MNRCIRRVEFHETVSSKVWDSRSSSLRGSGAQRAIKIRGILSLSQGVTTVPVYSSDTNPSEIMSQDGFESPAEFPAVIGPDAGAPVPVTTRLRAEQMKERVAVARFVRWNSRLDNFLEEVRTGLLHRAEEVVVAAHPGDIVRPTAALHVEPAVFLFQSLDHHGQFLGPAAGLEAIPDPLLKERLQGRAILLPGSACGQMLEILGSVQDRAI